MCAAADFSRAGYYRFLDPEKLPAGHGPARRNAADRARLAQLRKAAHAAGTAGPRLGCQPQAGATAATEDTLLSVTQRKLVVTTDCAHGLKVYPNLAASMTITGVNQLWVAAITYIRGGEKLRQPRSPKLTLSHEGTAMKFLLTVTEGRWRGKCCKFTAPSLFDWRGNAQTIDSCGIRPEALSPHNV